MSIKLRASLDQYLEDEDLHFDMTDEKKLAIKTKCGQVLVTFNDLVFAKKEPTRDEIEFVKKIFNGEIDEINNKLKRLKELEQNEPEKVNFYQRWKRDGTYGISENGLNFDVDIKTEEVSNIKIEVDKLEKIEDKIKQIKPFIKKLKKYIEWQEERKEIIEELNQNCNIW